jgi:hypothetical protein
VYTMCRVEPYDLAVIDVLYGELTGGQLLLFLRGIIVLLVIEDFRFSTVANL